MRCLAIAMLALWLAACGGAGDDADDVGACFEVQRDIPVQISRDLDILFVIDTSVSMLDRLEVLGDNVARFALVLENIEGGLPNVHIGAVSADVAGHGGALVVPRAECGIDGGFVRDIAYANGVRDANYGGGFAEAFGCLLTSAPLGGTVEEPLEAARRALDGSNPGNAGFRREHAALFVVFVTDEDDCSGGALLAQGADEAGSAFECFREGVVCAEDADTPGTKTACRPRDGGALTPVDDYAAFLRGLKVDPSMVLVSALTAGGEPVVAVSEAGPALEPACTAETMEWPAVRLRAFLDLFPQRAVTADVCGDDWSELMIPVAEILRMTLGVPCLEAEVDLDPATPGVQAECVMSEIRGANERLLPACSSADPPDAERPCWLLDADDPACVDFGVAFEVVRGRENVPVGTYVRARCFAGCYP